jgi:hypothetical protein
MELWDPWFWAFGGQRRLRPLSTSPSRLGLDVTNIYASWSWINIYDIYLPNEYLTQLKIYKQCTTKQGTVIVLTSLVLKKFLFHFFPKSI